MNIDEDLIMLTGIRHGDICFWVFGKKGRGWINFKWIGLWQSNNGGAVMLV